MIREYTNSQIANLISEHIHNIQHRKIMSDRLIDGITYEQLAEKHDMSVRQIKRIVYKYEMILLRFLP